MIYLPYSKEPILVAFVGMEAVKLLTKALWMLTDCVDQNFENRFVEQATT